MNNASGCFISNIDKRELFNYKQILDSILGIDNFVNAIVNVNNPKGRSDQRHLPTAHDNILFYANDGFISYGWNPTNKVIKRYNKYDEIGEKYREIDLRKTGDGDRRVDRENMFYFFYYNEINKDLIPSKEELTLDGYIRISPMKDEIIEGRWRWELDTSKTNLKRLIARFMPVKNQWSVFEMDYFVEGERVSPTSVWDEKPFNSERGTESFLSLGFEKEDFPRPKPVGLMSALFEHTTKEGDYILDYFLGSGTSICSIIELNSNSDKSRKYIGCEMGDYFDKITKPRILKTIYSLDWEKGKPVSREGISHCFKYMRLESYEDTLNNLEIIQSANQQQLLELNPSFKEGYMLNYMLDVETQGSLLNLEWFENPFDCSLRITRNNELLPTRVDLVETFNYLIGLVVENYAVPKEDYVVVTGKNLAGEKILVVWRNCLLYNNEALNAFLSKSKYNPLDNEFDRIYVNGDNNVENLKVGEERWKVVLIEEEFKKRMFENN